MDPALRMRVDGELIFLAPERPENFTASSLPHFIKFFWKTRSRADCAPAVLRAGHIASTSIVAAGKFPAAHE